MKKIISMSMAALLAVSLMAGCGNEKTEADGSGSANSASSKTSDSKGGSGKDISIMMNGTATDPTTALYQEIADTFSKDNEYGVKASLQMYENEQYKTKLTTLMASNSVPDIFFTWELDYLKPFVNGGKVMDITSYVDGDATWKDTFQDGVFEPLTYDGKIYAVPNQKSFTVMYYNKDLFEQNNVAIPTTYDEFLAACETFKQAGITPLSISCPDAWIPAQFIQQLTDGIGGMDVYNGLLDGSVKWNNDTHIQAGTEIQNIIDKGYLQDGFLGMTTEEGQKMFKDGKCAMYFQGAWDISAVTADDSAVKDVVGAFAMPAKNPENNGINVGSIDTSLAISATSKNPDAAFGYIKNFASKENHEKLLYQIGRLPSTKIDVDESKISPVTADVLKISSETKGLTPWLDRAFGAGEGVEFNNKCQAIYGGEDPKAQFDSLQQFAEDNANR